MSYAHIENMYRPEGQTILLFRECYALEKIHGTSAHVRWADGKIWYSSGGASRVGFEGLFTDADVYEDGGWLMKAFQALGHDTVEVYGEAYGGKLLHQSWRYGKALRFVAFDVRIGGYWLDVPAAADVVRKLGLEFVHYERCSTDLEALNAQRDAPSVQAQRCGIEGDQPREGIVVRPLIELCFKTGERICAKHKRDAERETASPREVVDQTKMMVVAEAEAIAIEWVTDTRLQHVLDKLPHPIGVEHTRDVIQAMIADIVREGSGEFVDSKEARKAIGKRTGELFKAQLKTTAQDKNEGA